MSFFILPLVKGGHVSNTPDNEGISTLTKILALAIVTVLMVVGFGILAFINKDSEPSFSCDTLRNPTACPEPPDPDEELYEQLKQYPDDSY